MNNQLLAGWDEISITPDKAVRLAGQFFERISETVETEVTATAMALESNGEGLILCSCDLVGIDDGLLKAVRQTVCNQTDLCPEQIILCATHTHTSLLYEGPKQLSAPLDIFEKYLPSQEENQTKTDCMSGREAFDFLIERISKVIRNAWRNRKPSGFANGFGRAAVGMCRRVVYSDGSAKMWGDTDSESFAELEGGNDSGIELLYIYDQTKKLTGIVANIACPSQVVEHRSFISSDYWGKVKLLLRERFGKDLFVLGLCSPAGDQCPRDMIRWVQPETPIDDPNIKRENPAARIADPSMFDINGTWKVGKRIANEIISVYEELGEIKNEVNLKHKSFTLDLPLRCVTEAETITARNALENYLHENGQTAADENASMHVHAGTLERAGLQKKQSTYPIEVHVFCLGNMVFATNPFELFLDYGNLIRARSKAEQTFLIQLSCGSSGYLPTQKAEKGGHYSAYVSSGFVGHEGGKLLVERTLEEIKSLMTVR